MLEGISTAGASTFFQAVPPHDVHDCKIIDYEYL